MASITTIAMALGISASTVSRAFKKPQMVSPKTRHQVLEEAKAQGYLISQDFLKEAAFTTPLIGVLVADLSNSFSSSIVKAVQDFACLKNCATVVSCSYEQSSLEKQVLKQWQNLNLKGLIVMPSLNFAEIFKDSDLKLPLVLVDRDLAELKCDSVVANNQNGMQQILDHLSALGHQKIAVITGNSKVYTFKQRGITAKQYQEQIEVIEINAVEFEELYMGAFEQTSLLLKRPFKLRPTAIVGANNALSAGIVYALSLNGIKIPEEISIVSYGDSKWGRFYSTPITSLRQPVEEMGTLACQILFERILGSKEEFKKLSLDPMLLTRASTSQLN